jgi:hypothetical protein
MKSPKWVCFRCGYKASGGGTFGINSHHTGKCGICKEIKLVTKALYFDLPKKMKRER